MENLPNISWQEAGIVLILGAVIYGLVYGWMKFVNNHMNHNTAALEKVNESLIKLPKEIAKEIKEVIRDEKSDDRPVA